MPLAPLFPPLHVVDHCLNAHCLCHELCPHPSLPTPAFLKFLKELCQAARTLFLHHLDNHAMTVRHTWHHLGKLFLIMCIHPRATITTSSDEDQSPAPWYALACPTKVYTKKNHTTSSDHDDRPLIREKTMAGVPSWPLNLHLSLNTNNWLEWS